MNPHDLLESADFKSAASANFAIRAGEAWSRDRKRLVRDSMINGPGICRRIACRCIAQGRGFRKP